MVPLSEQIIKQCRELNQQLLQRLEKTLSILSEARNNNWWQSENDGYEKAKQSLEQWMIHLPDIYEQYEYCMAELATQIAEYPYSARAIYLDSLLQSYLDFKGFLGNFIQSILPCFISKEYDQTIGELHSSTLHMYQKVLLFDHAIVKA